MAMAADIDDTINYTLTHVQRIANDAAATLRDQLVIWWATFAQFDEESEPQRTVRNWSVPTQFLIDRLPDAVGAQTQSSSEAVMVVYQACCAAKYAAADGRITGAQLTQVVSDWNDAWGYV